MHTLSRLSLLLAVGGLVTTSCVGVGDIDRTQPEKVKKDIFFKADGTPAEFYFRQTVIDVPATNGVTFIGEQSDTERVVFEITQDYLYAYRSYGWLQNDSTSGAIAGNQGDGYTRPGTGPYTGAPIAAFRIQSHFDVKRQYNPATGEQTNVIYEDSSDRPWYQRDYIRVDWTQNEIADFRFGSATALQTPASETIPEEDASNGTDKDRPKISSDYIDVVTKYNVEPESLDLSAYGYGKVPECYFSPWAMKDCLGGTIKVRHSFRRVPDNNDYLPLDYDDLRFQKFGFFRAERFTYDDQYGVVEPAQVKHASRWNIWKDVKSCYDPTKDLPYSGCKPDQLRTIVYYLNDDFPKGDKQGELLHKFALDTADQWNTLLTNAVKAATGFTDNDFKNHRMFTLCPNNPVQKGDPAECGEPGLNPQIGDLRFSMYYYIPNFQYSPPLGYGPSATDPLTGEIIAANAFYYGEAGGTLAARTLDSIKLQLGLLTDQDIIGGIPADQAVAAAQQAASAPTHARSMPDHIAQKAQIMASKYRVKEIGQRLTAQIADGSALIDKRPARLQALKTSGVDQLLVNDEMRQVMGPQLLQEGIDPSQADSVLAAGLFDNQAMFNHEQMRINRLLVPPSNGCILRGEDVFDQGLLGLTAAIKAKFYDTSSGTPTLKSGFTDEDVYNEILARTLEDTMLHEVGHTMGLRHNFAGSTDPLNFGPKYWQLRGLVMKSGDTRPEPEWNVNGSLVPLLQSALDQGIRDEQTSSVMDYSSTYGTRLTLGAYDFAAIKYAYGDLVEVFNSADINADKAKLLQPGEINYVYYPEIVSNAGQYADKITAMYDRHDVNFRKSGADGSIEVPYSFCSDEYREASATCNIWDLGADNFERTVYMTQEYRNYSIFSNFKRERLTFGLDIFTYLSRIYTVDMTYILNQYKNWVNDELIVRSGKTCLVPTATGVGPAPDGPDRFAAEECGLAGFLGSVEAVNLLGEILQEPDVGCYSRLQPGCYDTVASNAQQGSLQTDPDIFQVSTDPSFCDNGGPGGTPYQPAQPSASDTNAQQRVAMKVTAQTSYTHLFNSTACSESPNANLGASATGTCASDFECPANFGCNTTSGQCDYKPIVDNGKGINTAGASIMETPVSLGFRPGGARAANTLYDRNYYGYFFYNKPLTVGSWWDKWLAVKALGDPDTNFIGVDASSDARAFLISLNLLFGNDINDLIGGTLTGNANVYGPTVSTDGTDVEIQPVLDINSGGPIDRTQLPQPTIDPDQQYTFRLVAMMNAAYQGFATDRFEFGESLQIGDGFATSAATIDPTVKANPALYTEVTDPVSGRVWYALNQIRADDTNKNGLYSVGFNFINEIKDRYFVGGAAGDGKQLLPGFNGGSEFSVNQDLDLVRVMASTAMVFGYAGVDSGDIQF